MEKFKYLSKSKLNNLPKIPGVYAFLKGKQVLYIGKAANLRDRVQNHFHQPSYRDNLFISQITKVGYFETQSEIDALLLESQLIKSRQSKYNVMWKDDKAYFYIGITKETLPRVFITHQPNTEPSKSKFLISKSKTNPKFKNSNPTTLQTKNYKSFDLIESETLRVERPELRTEGLKTGYIGPFTEGKAIKRVLRLLRRVFPYYTARKHPVLPCPYCHIGLCPGPKPDAKEYKRSIENLTAVLKGRRVSVLNSLRKSMEQASKEQDFERAAVLRDQVFSLENVASHASLTWLSYPHLSQAKEKHLPKPWSEYTRIEAYDISNIQGKQSTGSMVTFLNGKPAKEWYRKFKIHRTGKANDFAMMQELISRRLKHADWPYPDLMLIDGGKGQLSSTLKAISNLARLSFSKLNRAKLQVIRVAALAKRNNELFSPREATPVLLRNLPQEVSNLLLYIRDEAHRFAISYHRRLRNKSVFE